MRMGMIGRFALCAAAMLLSGGLAFAEVIELKDGGKLDARVVKRGGLQLTIETDGIQLLVPEDIVKTVNGEKLPPDYLSLYDQRRQLAGKDADEHYRLALWCRQHKLEDQAKSELLQVVKIDPKHEDARELLGHQIYKNAWYTPEQLKAKGLVQHQGQWLTPDEAKAVHGKVFYLGQWLTEKEKEYLEDRQLRRHVDMWRSHGVCDLQSDIRMLSFVNQWGLSREELRGVYDTLMDAEKDRRCFMTKRHEMNENAEKAWLALKEAAMFGVINSFDQPKDIEGKAGKAEKMIKYLHEGYTYAMFKHSKRVLDAVSDKHKEDYYYGYCGACHCSRYIPSESFESKTFQEKYCLRCHRDGMPTAKDQSRPVAATAAPVSKSTIELLEKARCCSEAELKDLAKKVGGTGGKGKGKGKGSVTSKAEDVLKKARQCSGTEFERDKNILARQLEGMSELEALQAEQGSLGKGYKRFFGDKKTREMVVNGLFSGSFLEAVAARLKAPARAPVAKDDRKEEEVVSVTALMLDKLAFERKATEIIERKCGICHDTSVVSKPGRGVDAWRGTLRKMQEIGWNITDNDVALLSQYLSERSRKELAEFKAPQKEGGSAR